MKAAILIAVALICDAQPAFDMAALERYVQTSSGHHDDQRGVQTELSIRASLPRRGKRGELRTVRSVSCAGETTYQSRDFVGDDVIKREVIARYLAAGSQADHLPEIAVTPANYRFSYKGAREEGGRRVEIFRLAPRKKRVGLFKGELWVDAETGAPVREAGQFVRNPSPFIKRIVFVKNFDTRDGLVIPVEVRSSVDVRIVGRAELEVRVIALQQDSKNCASQAESVQADTGGQYAR